MMLNIKVIFLEECDAYHEGDVVWLEPAIAVDLIAEGFCEAAVAKKRLRKPPQDKMLRGSEYEKTNG